MTFDPYSIYVPPVGPKDAKIALVGEGPGMNEVERGEPFVGAAGQTLDELLASASLKRSEIFITNVTKYMPRYAKNKDDFFWHTINNGRKVISRCPTHVYMQGIIELFKELSEVRPNVVVPLGNYALWGLTQLSGIMNYRGSILESTLVPGLKVIPTIHPAFYGYEGKPEKKLLGNWDFLRIAEQSKFPEIRRKRRNFIVNPTPEQIEEAIERYTDPSLNHITCDTEWYNPNTLAYVGFAANSEEATCIVPNSMLAYRAIKTILGSKIPKVWQNAMFDAVALYRKGIKVENVAHDTMIEFHYSWGTVVGGKSLALIGSVLTEEPYYKDDVEFVGQDDERGQIYCCTDCVVTDEAHVKMQNEELDMTGTRRGYEISMSVMNTFIKASQIGVRVDREKLLELREKYLTAAREKDAWLSEQVGRSFNCRSPQQVSRLVYDDLGVGKRFTEKSTKQDVLMDIAATLDAEGGNSEIVEILKGIIISRQNDNICSRTLTEEIIDPTDGRTRSFWNIGGTKNGRLSTTLPWWNGVALQTMPDESREIIIADPGTIFVGWDLAQAEARDVAVRTRNWELLEAMDSGIDIHAMLAPVLGMTYEQVMAEVARVGKDACKPRQLLKITRHASNYFLTWAGLKMRINREFVDTGVGVDAATSKRLSQGYLDMNPNLEGWWAEVLSAMNKGSLINSFGRRRNFYGHTYFGSHEHRDGIAFAPQSDIADLTTLSIAKIDEEDWITPLAHMHDGGFVQVDEHLADDAVELMKKVMNMEFFVNGYPLRIPVDVKVGYNWRHMKKVA